MLRNKLTEISFVFYYKADEIKSIRIVLFQTKKTCKHPQHVDDTVLQQRAKNGCRSQPKMFSRRRKCLDDSEYSDSNSDVSHRKQIAVQTFTSLYIYVLVMHF